MCSLQSLPCIVTYVTTKKIAHLVSVRDETQIDLSLTPVLINLTPLHSKALYMLSDPSIDI